MKLTSAELQALAGALPKLQFVPDIDEIWAQSDLPQAYLNEYQINFAKEFSGVRHGFGKVDTDKYTIATHYWLPEQPRATLWVVHGYYDHVGIYDHVIRFALNEGYAVLAFDLPGHGLSSGDRAAIDSFDDYGDVLAALISATESFLPRPWLALGQSTGCAVLLNYMWRFALVDESVERFEKLVLCAPLVLPRGWRGFYMGRFLYALLKHFIRRLKRGEARSSHDASFNQFIMHQDCLQATHLSIRWVGAMKDWNTQFRQFAPLQKPLLIVQGTGDMTVDWRYNLPLIQQKLPQAHVHFIADAGHQLVNESDFYRAQVFDVIQRYLEQPSCLLK